MKKRTGDKAAFIGVRVEQEIADRLTAFCKENHTTASEVVRKLLLETLLSPDEKAADTKAKLEEIERLKQQLAYQEGLAQTYWQMSGQMTTGIVVPLQTTRGLHISPGQEPPEKPTEKLPKSTAEELASAAHAFSGGRKKAPNTPGTKKGRPKK